MEHLSILGATGSIGTSTLKIVDAHPDRFRVFALSANTNVDAMFKLCQRYLPAIVVMQDEPSAIALSALLKEASDSSLFISSSVSSNTAFSSSQTNSNAHSCSKKLSDIEVLSGQHGLETIASHERVDMVIAAIVGIAGLLSTFAAIRAGKKIALANKESLVVTGSLFMNAVSQYKATLLPVDSEHNAIFQCLGVDYRTGVRPESVDKITLTASGGPFRGKTARDLVGVRAADAIAHPNWSMGPKISTDSATLMNKGFEVIETHWLFQMPVDKIAVVIHPESIIHSFVHFKDGSTLAQLGNPDMRVPISHCMGWPKRLVSGVETLDILKISQLNFSEPDLTTFKCLPLAFEALRMGQAKTCILNAANEVAVSLFLQGRIGFLDIANVLEDTLSAISGNEDSLEAILDTDRIARDFAMDRCLTC